MSEVENFEFEDRPYQQAIIEVGIKRNSIVYLPTGAGKSHIAIQIIKHFSDELEKTYSDGGKRSVFLVNTNCLAKQQAEKISNELSFNVALLTGEQNVDYWDHLQWKKTLDENEILVSTAQVILDAIKQSFIKKEQINVIIFDECHHGRKDHPYHEIMKQFDEKQFNVRIIGLSGMLIGNNNKLTPVMVKDELEKLEATFISTIITVNNLDDYKNVLLCSTKAKEGYVLFNNQDVCPLVSKIMSMIEEKIKYLKNVKFENTISIDPKTLNPSIPKKVKSLIAFFNDFEYQSNVLGVYGGYLSLLSTLIQLELIKRNCNTQKKRQVVKACITITEMLINKMKLDLKLDEKDGNKIFEHSSIKFKQLLKLLKSHFNDENRSDDLQCIVFVERRSTAKIIYHMLKAYALEDPDFPIIPDFMVGINAGLPESIENILNNNYNTLTLDKFQRKETNCIVSSSVLEEGIDLQMCNLVICFDTPKTYRSYVQSRGRARDRENSVFAVFNEQGNLERFRKKVANWQEVDIEIKQRLLMKTLDRLPPSEEYIQNEREEIWPPFKTPISGSVLNNVNSVSLLERYASSLPSDIFTNIKLIWRRINCEDKTYIACVSLPTHSTIQDEIFSDPKSNVKLAKQHAAFKACKSLYEHGELNDNLTPIDKSVKVEQYNEEYFAHWNDYSEDKKSAGTRNHRRYHKIKTPNALNDCAPQAGDISYLYCIHVRPKFNPLSNAIECFKHLLGNQKEFGILTSKRIPRVCIMRLFQSYGEVEVEISSLPITVTIKNEDELNILRNFHVAIFRDVLKTWSDYFVLDRSSYIFVPLIEDCSIDFDLARMFQKVEKPRSLTYDEIKSTKFDRDDYHLRVINPVYRDNSIIPRNYVVIVVDESLTPLSPFPCDNNEIKKYLNYKDYVYKNFERTVVNVDHPMLEVKGISNELNLFFPGAGMSGQKKRKYEKAQSKEHYIPELCHNYKFPADYWLKATLLPSISHRLQMLLLAEELRKWLISEGIDSGHGDQNYKMDVDYDNYDERERMLAEANQLEEILNGLPGELRLALSKRKSSKDRPTNEACHTKPLLLWDPSCLPIDIDRNWLTVTQADIDYYCNFLCSNQNQISPEAMNKLKQLNSAARNFDNALMDSGDRESIKIIYLDGESSSVQQKDLIKVLTTSNAGDVFDMERYEVLGDGFLKFITSLYLYKKHDNLHEGYLTSLKGRIVSNRNLFYIGNNFGLSQMIKSSMFKAREVLPPSIILPEDVQSVIEMDKNLLIKLVNIPELSNDEVISGKIKSENLNLFTEQTANNYSMYQENGDNDDDDCHIEKSMLTYIKQHYVGDKIVADAVEALLGIVVHSLGFKAGLKLCQTLGILPQKENLTNLLTEIIPPRPLNKNVVPEQMKVHNRKKLEEIIGYQFKNPGYLVQALTHPSYPIKEMGTYQQLEFLGDAVLDCLISSYIFEQCPDMDPGKFTDFRSALVNNVTLACIVVRNELHKFMLKDNTLLSEAIQKFVSYQVSKQHQVVLDQIILLETEDDASTAESVDVPKVIGDIFESIVGAIFLDSGLNLETTWNVIYRMMKKELHEFQVNVPKQIVRQLFEFEKGKAEPKFYQAFEADEETIAVPVEVLCRGKKQYFVGLGKNQVVAKKCAAKLALRALMDTTQH
ncbi:CLUMA_CG012128, isoform A [Clunio marinus]|uniref:CLUMA_CG012128, isoform A n=1 Tax=Clunio marinus TaxID=568069 RepID=A0A1J1IHW7_9DIPT|nr:CLUMA_CG012128, isoform A [Clunio marinus]